MWVMEFTQVMPSSTVLIAILENNSYKSYKI